MDIQFQNSAEDNSKKDVHVMKVVHDLKNPIISIKQTIIDKKSTIENVRIACLSDIEDIEEMLENLRAEFKYKQGMSFCEVAKEIQLEDFAKTFFPTHKQLATNGKNKILVSLKPLLPLSLHIKKSLVKRIINNFVSNSLKHTIRGAVQIDFLLEKILDVKKFQELQHSENQIQIGTSIKERNQLCIEVRDCGKGIPFSKLHSIFLEKESDQNEDNWDGTGLGLPICKQLCDKIDSFILYSSVAEVETKFRLYIPVDVDSQVNLVTQEINYEQNQYINYNQSCIPQDGDVMVNKHVCNSILIVEDNLSIMRLYKRNLKNMNVPVHEFYNGLECYEFIMNSNILKCKLCTKILIVTDLQMPFMNGLELANKLRQNVKGKIMKLILVTADDIKNINEFDQIIEKPAQASQIKDIWKNQYDIPKERQSDIDECDEDEEQNSTSKLNQMEIEKN